MNELTASPSVWLDFLKRQGAQFADDGATLLGFGATAPAPQTLESFMAPLTDLGLIGVAGDDAASFLHSQLTNDVEKLDAASARLAGYCSPKGRLLATFLVWRNPESIFLQVPRAIQAPIQKRLQMFVMRAKAKLSDQTDHSAVLGLAGVAAPNALAEWFPVLPAAPYTKLDNSNGTLIRVADAGDSPRYQWITTPEIAMAAWPRLAQHLTPAAPSAWRLGEIRAGIAQVNAATQEQFVPQMVNFELVGGVNFKKGCYPGQEIVARSQYLGKLKRRAMLASVASADVAAGAEVFAINDPEQPCGMVINAETIGDGQSLALVEMKLAAAESEVRLGSAQGPALVLLTLPYALSEPQ